MPAPDDVIGWDIGGAHAKACYLRHGRVLDVAQWACPLWMGLQHLDAALTQASARWPSWRNAVHVVTMTGEMVDLFPDREAGVRGLVAHLAQELPSLPLFYAGERGFCQAADAPGLWPAIASANWRASASWAARRLAGGLLVDIGSTTTDLIAFRGGKPLGSSLSDADRLASGELVYQGVVRTPLCALAPRILFRGRPLNVMNELFATTADIYRLTGELDPAHDQQPSADNGPKNDQGTQQRLARMLGQDARDAGDADWLAVAQAWRAAQVAELGGQLRRVAAAHALGDDAAFVAAGCGAFLLPDVLAAAGRAGAARRDFGADLIPMAPEAAAGAAEWSRIGAPSVAVALLFATRQEAR
jgi:(4-(4-[2-(gamma-L-glutamylamino)ethyl]phenoxymethyl)furan-2-yl)methanamine synthase